MGFRSCAGSGSNLRRAWIQCFHQLRGSRSLRVPESSVGSSLGQEWLQDSWLTPPIPARRAQPEERDFALPRSQVLSSLANHLSPGTRDDCLSSCPPHRCTGLALPHPCPHSSRKCVLESAWSTMNLTHSWGEKPSLRAVLTPTQAWLSGRGCRAGAWGLGQSPQPWRRLGGRAPPQQPCPLPGRHLWGGWHHLVGWSGVALPFQGPVFRAGWAWRGTLWLILLVPGKMRALIRLGLCQVDYCLPALPGGRP